jgi:ubiquinone/menaquinone biosynthesis C-methylase UbiE
VVSLPLRRCSQLEDEEEGLKQLIIRVVAGKNCAIAEIYRVLKPRGRCFIAEPRYVFRASIPLFAMWMLARVTHSANGYREPCKAKIFSADAFKKLFVTQPWQQAQTWQEGRNQYALCEKG